MEVTETSAEGLRRELTVVVPAGELEDQISRRLGEIGRSVRLPGFRPGKVPMQILRRRFGPAVRGEVLESTVQGGSAEAIRERNLRPALPPKLEIVSAEEGGDLHYKLSLEVLPEIPEPNFNDLGLERLVTEAPDEEVDQALQRLAEQQRKSEAIERAAQTGDIVVVDFVGRIGEDEIPGGSGQDRQLELGGGSFIPGFEDQLVGAAAGESRTVQVTFPEAYGAPNLAGKEATFAVTVKEVRERVPAAVDDQLAKEVGLDSLSELRDEIRQRMQRDYDTLARQRLKGALLDKLAERFDFPVPPGMLDLEFENIWAQYQAEKQRHEGAQTEEAAAEDVAASEPTEAGSDGGSEAAAPAETGAVAEDEEARAEYRRIAERRVRLGLLLAEIGRNNNINVTQEELNQALAREAQRHPGYERQVLDYYRKNPDAFGNLRAPIFEDKVIDFVLELAKVGERKVTPQELIATGEAEETGSSADPP